LLIKLISAALESFASHLARALVVLLAAPMLAAAMLKLILLLVLFLVFLPDRVDCPGLLPHGAIDTLDAALAEATLVDAHDPIELSFTDVALVLDALLEFPDHLHVVTLLLMLVLHLKVLQRFVELLVFGAKLLFFEGLDFDLLFQKLALHFDHVFVRLEHLRVEIIRPADGHA